MARSIPVIYQQLLAQKQSQNNLNNQLTSNSQVSIWNLWLWITAVGQNLFEQLCDLFQANMEALIANAPVFTPQWIVQMCKNFQYSATNPQVVQLNVSNAYPYLTIGYPVVNSVLSPVTQAAVVSTTNHELIIKVTGASGPLDSSAGTTGPICKALESYLNEILTPDTQYLLINDNPDLIFIHANIFYNASYSGVIQANVQSAINGYLQSIPFNGDVFVSALEEAILAVAGVNDIILNDVYLRRAIDPIPTGGLAPNMPPTNELTQMVKASTLISRFLPTYAGYVVPETTGSYTLNDFIIYNPS